MAGTPTKYGNAFVDQLRPGYISRKIPTTVVYEWFCGHFVFLTPTS